MEECAEIKTVGLSDAEFRFNQLLGFDLRRPPDLFQYEMIKAHGAEYAVAHHKKYCAFDERPFSEILQGVKNGN